MSPYQWCTPICPQISHTHTNTFDGNVFEYDKFCDSTQTMNLEMSPGYGKTIGPAKSSVIHASGAGIVTNCIRPLERF